MKNLQLVHQLLQRALALLEEHSQLDGKIHVWSATFTSRDNFLAGIAAIVNDPDREEMILTQLAPFTTLEEAEIDALYLGLSSLLNNPARKLFPIVVHITSPILLALLDNLEMPSGQPSKTMMSERFQEKLRILSEMVTFLKNLSGLETCFHMFDDRANLVRCQDLAREIFLTSVEDQADAG